MADDPMDIAFYEHNAAWAGTLNMTAQRHFEAGWKANQARIERAIYSADDGTFIVCVVCGSPLGQDHDRDCPFSAFGVVAAPVEDAK